MTTPRPYRLRTSRSPWSRWAGFVLIAFIAAASAALLTGCVRNSADDTDGPNKRSGLSLYTDHLTGCQYVGWHDSYGAAIYPRLDGDGKQVCK